MCSFFGLKTCNNPSYVWKTHIPDKAKKIYKKSCYLTNKLDSKRRKCIKTLAISIYRSCQNQLKAAWQYMTKQNPIIGLILSVNKENFCCRIQLLANVNLKKWRTTSMVTILSTSLVLYQKHIHQF